jgi:DNA-binding MarR family transcriptional regulator
MTATDSEPQAWPYVIGHGGLAGLGDRQAEAWAGLLRVHRRLIREVETALQVRYGLSLSALELLGRLADADQRRMRIARLAEQAGLSLSRTSRLLDTLEQRGLLKRQPCPEDSRASNVQLTAAGLRLAGEARAAHLAEVQRVFFDRLTSRQVHLLAAAFLRLAPQRP